VARAAGSRQRLLRPWNRIVTALRLDGEERHWPPITDGPRHAVVLNPRGKISAVDPGATRQLVAGSTLGTLAMLTNGAQREMDPINSAGRSARPNRSAGPPGPNVTRGSERCIGREPKASRSSLVPGRRAGATPTTQRPRPRSQRGSRKIPPGCSALSVERCVRAPAR